VDGGLAASRPVFKSLLTARTRNRREIDLAAALKLGCGGRIWTFDLWVMKTSRESTQIGNDKTRLGGAFESSMFSSCSRPTYRQRDGPDPGPNSSRARSEPTCPDPLRRLGEELDRPVLSEEARTLFE